MKQARIPLLAILLLFLVATVASAERSELRVGIFPMKPLNFVDEQGNAQGLNPDLLREAFQDEQWRLVFVPGSWGECYDRLLKGEIDLLTTVAHTPERAEIFDFNREPVADILGKVYTRAGANITDIRDLAEKPVAVVRRDSNGRNFIKTAGKFEVKPRIVELETHDDIFSAIQKGDVAAGVVPQHFGFREAGKYGLVATTIEFESFNVFFATPKGKNGDVLKIIDEHLAAWKTDPGSIYFKRVSYWMGGVYLERTVIPRWLLVSLFSVLGGAVFLGIVNIGLKRQVRLRTREIADREALFRRLSETTKAVPWELDPATGKFTYIGPRIVDIFGFPAEELTDMSSWAARVHPDDRQWAVDFCSAESAKGKDHDFIYRAIHRDGHVIWVHDIITVAMGPHGPEKLYGYFVDITEIREHEQRFQKMFREHFAVMLLVDPESGAIVEANDAACTYYGYPRDEMIAMQITAINISPEDLIFETLQVAKNLQRNYFESKHRLASGEIRDVEAYSYPITINNRPILFAILHDITDRKKLQAESGRNAQLAALGTIAAGVAHEINNPIQGIVNYAAILQSAANDQERIKEIAQRIDKEANRIAKITRNLLDYSRDDRNERRYADPAELVGSALSLITTKVNRSGIEIVTVLDPGLPKLMVNPQGIQQIVINLVDNAYDALRYKDTPADSKIIRIQGGIVNRQGQTNFCLEVSDNGIGMSADVARKARDAFFSTKPSSEGTGLGLSIVSEIVATHQGQMEIDSEEGEGTKIRVFLPIN